MSPNSGPPVGFPRPTLTPARSLSPSDRKKMIWGGSNAHAVTAGGGSAARGGVVGGVGFRASVGAGCGAGEGDARLIMAL